MQRENYGFMRKWKYPFLFGLLIVDIASIVLLSLFNYRIFYIESSRSYEENFMQYEGSITDMALNNIDSQLATYMELPDYYFSAVSQNEVFLNPQITNIVGNPERVRDLSDILFRIHSSYKYLYSMDIYYQGTGTAVTGFGNIHSIDDESELLEFCPWFSSLPENAESCLLPIGRNSYPTSEPVITYVRKISSAAWNGNDVYVALHMLPEIITDYLTVDENHSLYIIDSTGRVVYGYGDDRELYIVSKYPSGIEGPAKLEIDGEEMAYFFRPSFETGLQYSYLVNYSFFGQLNSAQNRHLNVLFMFSILLNIIVLSGLSVLNYFIFRLNIRMFSEKAGLPISGNGIDGSLSSMTAQIKNLHSTAESAKELRTMNIIRSIVLSGESDSDYLQFYSHFSGSYVQCCIVDASGRKCDMMAAMYFEQFMAENDEGHARVLCTFISPSSVVILLIVDSDRHLLDELKAKVVRLSGGCPVNFGNVVSLGGNGFAESYRTAQEVDRYRFIYSGQILSYDELEIDGRKTYGNHSKQLEQLERDMNSKQTELFCEHIQMVAEDLRTGGYDIRYCLGVISDIAVRVYSYMLRNQLDTWIVFGYDIREVAKQSKSLDDFMTLMTSSIATIYKSMKYRDENIDSDIRQQIEMIINDEIENDISLSLIADKLGMKTYELSRMFSRTMGKNYIDYIKDKKLMKAVEMLRAGEAVQDIARRLGYRSPQYFIRIFKENYGTTPYQYKKTVLETEGK